MISSRVLLLCLHEASRRRLLDILLLFLLDLGPALALGASATASRLGDLGWRARRGDSSAGLLGRRGWVTVDAQLALDLAKTDL